VTISKGFYLSEAEVTQVAYQRVTGNNPSKFEGLELPVEQVTWDEANGYCRQIGGRLPTAAEWEYAGRAGSTAARYGDIDRVAWYMGNIASKAHPVKQKEPNALGLYDMLGNVWDGRRTAGNLAVRCACVCRTLTGTSLGSTSSISAFGVRGNNSEKQLSIEDMTRQE
jgi:formylglycine-generating enzyme required for sulfatase activity